MQAAKAAEPQKFPCPVDFWSDFRADQIVAETAKCTVMQARELAPLEYNELLFLGSALEEAKPIAEAHAEAKAKMKAKNPDTPRTLGSVG